MEELKIWQKDSWLEPYKREIWERYSKSIIKRLEIAGYNNSLESQLNGHLWYGCHQTANGGYVFREWAPNATEIFLLAEFNGWRREINYKFNPLTDGNWELILPPKVANHGALYKLLICWGGGEGERLPAYARRVVQDESTKLFCAQIWDPAPYLWRHPSPPAIKNPLIYEVHIGMSSEEPKVASFNHFRENVLPYVASLGYNAIQIMAIQEHPYYGSFGYQVSNFFAVSSRFGTPEEFKALVDEAHGMGIGVIMDLVHSHSVSNDLEGLSNFDGTRSLYFHGGERGMHPAWGSRCFDYGKEEVLRFLLTNCKFWLNEYKIDGFRFDGVTSMLYLDHGLEREFLDYSVYFNDNIDREAVTYLTLANMVVKEVNPDAITIAEEVSGMPGLAAPAEWGGMGFDFRLSMGVPDLWIKWIKERRDEEWNVEELFYELTRQREGEGSISYAESHDQALVGDKTILFRLLDSEIYTSMSNEISSITVDRAIALHKMIRAITATTAGEGYLTFMGNEFGHPEWIDFPREGNEWSYHYARRQWSLVNNPQLRYKGLMEYERELLLLLSQKGFFDTRAQMLYCHNERQLLIFTRGNYLFAYNFSPLYSYESLTFAAPAGKYITVIDSDSALFGGFDRVDPTTEHFTIAREGAHFLSIYIPARCALILKKV